MKKVFLVSGARPNFMKIAPIFRELKKYPEEFEAIIIHTGQHYDYEMSKIFFEDLNIPEPNIYLGVGSGNHGEQTGKIMIEFEKVCLKEPPDLVIVVGDVNSTLAAALVAVKLHIQLAHIEAGLRSFDRIMPEEINRILTDVVSDFLFTTCEDGDLNLKREGIPESKIFLVGDVMVDTLFDNQEKVDSVQKYKDFGLVSKEYALLTLHRAENVTTKDKLRNILEALNEIVKEIPIIFPAHPGTLKQIKKFGLSDYFCDNDEPKKIRWIKPLGYIEFQSLLKNSRLVLTDSGGMQEETSVLNIPCLTLRENTERPITLTKGTNVLVGSNIKRIIEETHKILGGSPRSGGDRKTNHSILWDGRASERIIKILREKFCVK